jgi:hypothetical protein
MQRLCSDRVTPHPLCAACGLLLLQLLLLQLLLP